MFNAAGRLIREFTLPMKAINHMACPRILCIALISFVVAACTRSPIAEIPAESFIDAEVERLMASEDVKGLAIAVIDDGEIQHVASYGYRNVERELPLETDTIMYGASLTKAAFAYMVLQLVDEEVIDLDKTIDEYLPRPLPEYEDWRSLEGDDQWKALTPRIILTHSTGLTNLRFLEENQDLKFHFAPGGRYAYSGEGFYILQTVLEEGFGLNVKDEMQARIFDRFGMRRTSMQWRDDFAKNLADGYAMDDSFEPHDERSYVSASGSMDTTIADQAHMWRGMLRGEGLTAASRAEFVRPQLPIRSARQFPSLASETDPRGPEINLSAGLGVVTYNGPDGLTWSKGGHNPWTGNMVICQEARRRCLVMLANSVRAELIYPEIAQLILGDTHAPWWWDYGSD